MLQKKQMNSQVHQKFRLIRRPTEHVVNVIGITLVEIAELQDSAVALAFVKLFPFFNKIQVVRPTSVHGFVQWQRNIIGNKVNLATSSNNVDAFVLAHKLAGDITAFGHFFSSIADFVQLTKNLQRLSEQTGIKTYASFSKCLSVT